MRLAGAMTIHRGAQPEFAERVIADLAGHVEALFILENGDAEPTIVRAAKSCPKLAAYAKTDLPYDSQGAIATGHALHSQLFALLEDAKPEMVLFPDADELLPPNVEEIISLMEGCSQHGGTESTEKAKDTENGVSGNPQNPPSVASAPLRALRASVLEKKPAMCVEFPVLVCAGDAEHVIRDAAIHAKYHGPQVTLCRWRPGQFDFAPGYNYPAADYVGKSIVSPWPKRHLYVATPAAWRARYAFKPQPWMVRPWNVVAYDPKVTWQEWLR